MIHSYGPKGGDTPSVPGSASSALSTGQVAGILMTTAITTIKRDRYAVEPGSDIYVFAVGAIYYGNLTCSHGEHKLVCVKRTAKSVWLSSVVPAFITQDGTVHTGESWQLPHRSKVKWWDSHKGPMETTDAQGWTVWADATNCASEPNTY